MRFTCISSRARQGDPSDPSSLASFQVSVNDHAVLDGFDPISEAGGPDRLHSRVIRDISPAKDGKIHLGFPAGID